MSEIDKIYLCILYSPKSVKDEDRFKECDISDIILFKQGRIRDFGL